MRPRSKRHTVYFTTMDRKPQREDITRVSEESLCYSSPSVRGPTAAARLNKVHQGRTRSHTRRAAVECMQRDP